MSVDYEYYKNGGLLNDRYLKVEDISEGAYGIVSLAKDTLRDDKLVAVKYITQFTDEQQRAAENNRTPEKVTEMDVSKSGSAAESHSQHQQQEDRSAVLAEARQEIDILKKLGSHPNITELYDSFDSYLVLEYCPRGDLYDIIKSSCGPVTSKDIVDVMSQLLDAVTYAHSVGIYHRDIKPENILVADDWSIKLTDWGLATDNKVCTDLNVGSERYMAPELFDSKNVETYEADKCDIWSLGICLLNVVFGKNPFTIANQTDKLFVNFAANRETVFDIFPTMSYELFNVLRYSLTIDPENRDLELMKSELLKVRHLTLDYDLESAVSDIDGKIMPVPEERSKSNPVVISSPEKKFVIREYRKPLEIPSRRYKIGGGRAQNHYHNNIGNNNANNNNTNVNPQGGLHRQEFFTPKSVLNNYMDKIDKYHRDARNNNNDSYMRNDKNRSKYFKRKNPNKRAWRKSYIKKPISSLQSTGKNSYANDGVFLKPNSIKRISPPSSHDVLKSQRQKRYSLHSHSSSTGKYVPPNLRSPRMEPRSETEAIDNTEYEDDNAFEGLDDVDDDMFMLEEYKSSPKKADKLKRDLKFNYPPTLGNTFNSVSVLNSSSASTTSNSTSSGRFLLPMQQPSVATPLASSSSNGSNANKYVPPHHRRNSHSAVLSHRSRLHQSSHVTDKSKRSSFLASSDFDLPSVPSTWSVKSDRANKANQKFNKTYKDGSAADSDFSVNDMYHTFAKIHLSSNEAGSKDSVVLFSDDSDEEDEVDADGVDTDSSNTFALKNGTFRFAARAIPSFTG